MNTLEVETIVMRARAGAVYGECVRHAIQKAADEGVDVEFTHNGKVSRLEIKDLYGCVRAKPSEE